MADPLLFIGKCILKLSLSGEQAHDEITVVAPDAEDTHGTQTRHKNKAASSVLYKILRPETPCVQRNVPLHVRSQRVGSLELDAPEEK